MPQSEMVGRGSDDARSQSQLAKGNLQAPSEWSSGEQGLVGVSFRPDMGPLASSLVVTSLGPAGLSLPSKISASAPDLRLSRVGPGACDVRASLIAIEPGRISAAQIMAAHLAIKRKIKTGGATKGSLLSSSRIFPHFPVTKKPAEVRMGKGKGSVNY